MAELVCPNCLEHMRTAERDRGVGFELCRVRVGFLRRGEPGWLARAESSYYRRWPDWDDDDGEEGER